MKRIYLDTETSGMIPGQIGQLSMIIENEDGSIETRNYFFKVNFVEEGASKVTNRTHEDYLRLSEGQIFAERAEEIVDILDNNIIIAHNAKFDINYIDTELRRLGLSFKPGSVFDTMTEYKTFVGALNRAGRLKNPKLVELINKLELSTDKLSKYSAELYHSENNDFHDARFDTTAMFVACKVCDELSRGEHPLWQERFKYE